MHKPFTIYRRPTRKKKRYIYYIQFRDEAGRRKTAVSSGKTTRAEAERWAYERLKESLGAPHRELSFGAYAKSWFLWDECEYLRRKRNRGDYSKSYAEQQRAYLENHILPCFADLKLRNITVSIIENWIVELKDRFSAVTANRALTVLKIMLKEAKRRRLLPYNPGEDIEKLPENSKEKGILTLDEFSRLFDPHSFARVWDSSLFHYALNMLTSVTGLRLGEIQAIRWKNMNECYLHIEASWNRKYGLRHPKAQSSRFVSMPCFVDECLRLLREREPMLDSDTFVFHGDSFHRPIDHKVVTKRLYRALECIGISDEERRMRNLTFHSWRHFLNSNLRAAVGDADLRKITGHRTLAMTDHYDHQTAQTIARVRPHQENLLGIKEGSLMALSK